MIFALRSTAVVFVFPIIHDSKSARERAFLPRPSNPQTFVEMLLKYLALVVALLAISVLAGKKEKSENIVISDDAVVMSSGGKKHSNNIVIKEDKKKKCSCHVEVEHWGWQHWQPQHNSWGWHQKKKGHDHWKRK